MQVGIQYTQYSNISFIYNLYDIFVSLSSLFDIHRVQYSIEKLNPQPDVSQSDSCCYTRLWCFVKTKTHRQEVGKRKRGSSTLVGGVGGGVLGGAVQCPSWLVTANKNKNLFAIYLQLTFLFPSHALPLSFSLGLLLILTAMRKGCEGVWWLGQDVDKPFGSSLFGCYLFVCFCA